MRESKSDNPDDKENIKDKEDGHRDAERYAHDRKDLAHFGLARSGTELALIRLDFGARDKSEDNSDEREMTCSLIYMFIISLL